MTLEDDLDGVVLGRLLATTAKTPRLSRRRVTTEWLLQSHRQRSTYSVDPAAVRYRADIGHPIRAHRFHTPVTSRGQPS